MLEHWGFFHINLKERRHDQSMFEYSKPIVELIKVSIEKHGLWQTIFAFLVLFSIPILFWKLPEIILAIKS